MDKFTKFTALAASLAVSAGAQADQWAEVMNLSKTAGHCGVVSQLFTFQDATKMPGGEDFVMRFLTTEARRAGFSTPLELIQYCKRAAKDYVKLTAAVKDEVFVLGFLATEAERLGLKLATPPPSGISSTAARILSEELPAARPAVRTEPKPASGPSMADRILGRDWKCQDCQP